MGEPSLLLSAFSCCDAKVAIIIYFNPGDPKIPAKSLELPTILKRFQIIAIE